jgi:hypothetical protein
VSGEGIGRGAGRHWEHGRKEGLPCCLLVSAGNVVMILTRDCMGLDQKLPTASVELSYMSKM